MSVEIQPPLIINPAYGIINYTAEYYPTGDITIASSNFTLLEGDSAIYNQAYSDWEIWDGPDGTGNLWFQSLADPNDLTYIYISADFIVNTTVTIIPTILYARIKYYAENTNTGELVTSSSWSLGNAVTPGVAFLEQVPAPVCPNPITGEPCFDPFEYTGAHYGSYPLVSGPFANSVGTPLSSGLKNSTFRILKSFSNTTNNNVKNIAYSAYSSYKPADHSIFAAKYSNLATFQDVKCKIVTKINLSATLIIPALFSCNLNINHIPTNLYSIQFVSKIYPVKTSILGKLCNTIKLGFNNSELHFNQPRYGSLCRTYEEYRAIPIKFCFTPLYTGLYYQGMTTSFGFIYKQFSNTGRAIGAPSNRPITKITTIIKTASNASNGDKRITNIFTLQKWRCSSILTARPLRMVFIGRLNSTYRFSFTKTLGRK